jgi:protein-disulfide isomerase
MANKRVEAGRGRKPGVVKTAKKSSPANRAFYLLIAVVAIVGIAALTYASTRTKTETNASPIDTTLPPVKSEGYLLGNPSAPVEVTEFGDFECPACGRFAVLTEPDVRKNFVDAGKIRWRFIDFPLGMHKNTWNASRAAACADEQGKFWPFHDLLYQSQDQWNGEATDNPDKFMKQYARQLGLNGAQFDQCVDSKKYQAKIQAHYQIAMERKINSTPTFYIGSQEVAQALPYDQMAKYIDDALATAARTGSGAGTDTTKSTAAGAAKNAKNGKSKKASK